MEKVDFESHFPHQRSRTLWAPKTDCLCAVSYTQFHLTYLRRQELKSSVTLIFRNLYDSTNNTVDMQCLLEWDKAAKIKEFAKEHI